MTRLNKNRNKKIIILVLVLALMAAAYLSWNQFRTKSDSRSPTGTMANTGDTYSSPTNEEQEAGDKQKEINKQREQSQQANPQNSGKKAASVIITDAGQYDDVIEVRAFIPDHYQDGTCTITITKDNHKVSKSTPAYRDVSTTICTNPLFARSEFAETGEWQAVVSYSAEGAQGSSEPKNITIN